MKAKDTYKKFPDGTYTVIGCVKEGEKFLMQAFNDSDVLIEETAKIDGFIVKLQSDDETSGKTFFMSSEAYRKIFNRNAETPPSSNQQEYNQQQQKPLSVATKTFIKQ
ncbi:MAG: hypothetical protein KAI61_01840 [Alphaproteobacteria bacterium]|nr:hypothetical protein [Alphaproteobacteria bacterium]